VAVVREDGWRECEMVMDAAVEVVVELDTERISGGGEGSGVSREELTEWGL
jgi:hypothetical protein